MQDMRTIVFGQPAFVKQDCHSIPKQLHILAFLATGNSITLEYIISVAHQYIITSIRHFAGFPATVIHYVKELFSLFTKYAKESKSLFSLFLCEPLFVLQGEPNPPEAIRVTDTQASRLRWCKALQNIGIPNTLSPFTYSSIIAQMA